MSTRILGIDLETTGVDLEKDDIVEIGIAQWLPSADPYVILAERVKPRRAIPPQATAVHGITNEDVARCPPFGAIAQEVQEILFAGILAGFNSRRFDVMILDRELREAGQAGIDFERVREIDGFRAWYTLQPRTLEEFAKEYAPEHEHRSHAADGDAVALLHALDGFCERYDLTFEDLEAMTKPEDEVDRFGKFRLDESGEICFNFGKHKGKPALSEQEYLKWMLRSDTSFHPHIKAIIRSFLFEQTSAL